MIGKKLLYINLLAFVGIVISSRIDFDSAVISCGSTQDPSMSYSDVLQTIKEGGEDKDLIAKFNKTLSATLKNMTDAILVHMEVKDLRPEVIVVFTASFEVSINDAKELVQNVTRYLNKVGTMSLDGFSSTIYPNTLFVKANEVCYNVDSTECLCLTAFDLSYKCLSTEPPTTTTVAVTSTVNPETTSIVETTTFEPETSTPYLTTIKTTTIATTIQTTRKVTTQEWSTTFPQFNTTIIGTATSTPETTTISSQLNTSSVGATTSTPETTTISSQLNTESVGTTTSTPESTTISSQFNTESVGTTTSTPETTTISSQLNTESVGTTTSTPESTTISSQFNTESVGTTTSTPETTTISSQLNTESVGTTTSTPESTTMSSQFNTSSVGTTTSTPETTAISLQTSTAKAGTNIVTQEVTLEVKTTLEDTTKISLVTVTDTITKTEASTTFSSVVTTDGDAFTGNNVDKDNDIWIYILILVVSIVVISIVICILCACKYKRKQNKKNFHNVFGDISIESNTSLKKNSTETLATYWSFGYDFKTVRPDKFSHPRHNNEETKDDFKIPEVDGFPGLTRIYGISNPVFSKDVYSRKEDLALDMYHDTEEEGELEFTNVFNRRFLPESDQDWIDDMSDHTVQLKSLEARENVASTIEMNTFRCTSSSSDISSLNGEDTKKHRNCDEYDSEESDSIYSVNEDYVHMNDEEGIVLEHVTSLEDESQVHIIDKNSFKRDEESKKIPNRPMIPPNYRKDSGTHVSSTIAVSTPQNPSLHRQNALSYSSIYPDSASTKNSSEDHLLPPRKVIVNVEIPEPKPMSHDASESKEIPPRSQMKLIDLKYNEKKQKNGEPLKRDFRVKSVVIKPVNKKNEHFQKSSYRSQSLMMKDEK